VFDGKGLDGATQMMGISFANADSCLPKGLVLSDHIRSLIGSLIVYLCEPMLQFGDCLDVGVVLLGSVDLFS
jgi:hypothetical protein